MTSRALGSAKAPSSCNTSRRLRSAHSVAQWNVLVSSADCGDSGDGGGDGGGGGVCVCVWYSGNYSQWMLDTNKHSILNPVRNNQ